MVISLPKKMFSFSLLVLDVKEKFYLIGKVGLTNSLLIYYSSILIYFVLLFF
jgi:hypothetical protein